jgi:hypothetical protein
VRERNSAEESRARVYMIGKGQVNRVASKKDFYIYSSDS